MLENWGQMTKAQDDSTTIDEAIASAISAHEADPESHMGEGESIENHRINEVIDHPAGSVPIDKFSFSRLIKTWFESIDGWSVYKTLTGNVTAGLGALFLTTGATINSVASVNALGSVFVGLNMNKAFYWRTTLQFSSTTNFLSYWGMGYLIDLDEFNGFGFRYVGGVLQAYMGDYTNLATVTISGIDLTIAHVYEIRHTVVPQKAEFYIDGNLVATFDSGNFPDNADEFVNYLIKNTSATTRNMAVSDFQYEQER
jgi:hypothetical protein